MWVFKRWWCFFIFRNKFRPTMFSHMFIYRTLNFSNLLSPRFYSFPFTRFILQYNSHAYVSFYNSTFKRLRWLEQFQCPHYNIIKLVLTAPTHDSCDENRRPQCTHWHYRLPKFANGNQTLNRSRSVQYRWRVVCPCSSLLFCFVAVCVY